MTASAAPRAAEREVSAADVPPHVQAAATDHFGRICEGTTRRATSNCRALADFALQRPRANTVDGYACVKHVGQVALTANGGESGEKYEHRLIPIRTQE